MNWWNIFILFLCILEYCCLRQFLNLLQASLHFSKQQLPSIVTLLISANSSYLISRVSPKNSMIIKLFCINLSHNVVGLSTQGSTKWICLAQTHMKHDKHYSVSQCWTILACPIVFWTITQSDCSFSCLCLISGKYNFGFGSRCSPVVGGHGREAVWYGALSVPPSMTHVHRLIPRPPLWSV